MNIEPGMEFGNRAAWKQAQENNQGCSSAKHFLSTGKPPPVGKNSGAYFNDVRHYCRKAIISKDGLLVVKAAPSSLSGNVSRERIIIPKPLLWHLHNHGDNHPTKIQQKLSFQRQFHALSLDKYLDMMYEDCYKCKVLQKLNHQEIKN